MAEMRCATKGNASPNGKPRVYFTCHPEDFERYFDAVCQDIFRTHDCAVYYTADMSESIPAEDRATDLERHSLFVIPVTLRLLTEASRAMDEDFPYAQAHHIPVLPILMEPGLDSVYSRPDRFGELQYLYPHSTDNTEISYREKLKKYLDSVLISDELAQKVRAAFDAYIFLSYRKKDRRYANELMRLIHRNPVCRDIAVWYDEFLTPGESFRDGIDRILGRSSLFTLLVTPNLLEEPNGKPNFVMGEEYPAALRAGIDILPAEMEGTDRTALREKFRDIPPCVDPRDEETFRVRLLESVSHFALTANDDDPAHSFLIGLAYLDGIDVEVDRVRALELITSAAEAGLPEAMAKLYEMYKVGTGVKLDYRETARWAQYLTEYYLQHRGEQDSLTLAWMGNLAGIRYHLGEYREAARLNEKLYALRRELLGEEHPDVLLSLNNLAQSLSALGEYKKALQLKERVYDLHRAVWGDAHPDTLTAQSNLACGYGVLGNRRKERELHEKVYASRRKLLGEEHVDTLNALSNLAVACGDLGEYQRYLDLSEKAYELYCGIRGEEHPDTLSALNNLAVACGCLGDRRRELELNERAYALYCRVLGEKHPDTISSLSNLACCYSDLGEHQKAAELTERAYLLQCGVLGERHPDTLTSLNNLACYRCSAGDLYKARDLSQKAYALRREVLGEVHPDTVGTLNNLAFVCERLGDHRKALELHETAYGRCRDLLGEEHPRSVTLLINLSAVRFRHGDRMAAAAAMERACALSRKIHGPEHPDTLGAEKLLDGMKKTLSAR